MPRARIVQHSQRDFGFASPGFLNESRPLKVFILLFFCPTDRPPSQEMGNETFYWDGQGKLKNPLFSLHVTVGMGDWSGK